MSTTETITIQGTAEAFSIDSPATTELQYLESVREGEFPGVVAADNDPEPEPEYPSGLKLFLVFLALSLALLLSGLDGNIIATAIPSITDHFHTVADVGWYYTAYRLSACAFQFLFGKLYKLYSAKRLFIITQAIFLLGSILCASAVTSRMFVVGRAVTGIGIAGGAAGMFTLLLRILPPQKRPFYMGMVGAIEGVSSIVAPTLGGVITQRLSWRWCFWINVPIGGASIIALTFLLPETQQSSDESRPVTWKDTLRDLDLLGTLAFVPSLAALFIALNWAGITYSWSDPRIIALLVVFGVLLVAFIVDQVLQGDSAALPLRVLKNRNVIAGFVFAFCTTSSLNMLEYYIPTYFQVVQGYSPAHSGYLMLPLLVGALIAMPIQGIGTSLLGYYTPFMIACSVLMSIGAGLITTWTLSTDVAKLITYSALVGFAGGIGFLGPQSSVQTALSAADVPLGMAIILFAQNFGPALFVSIAQATFTNRLSANLHQFTGEASAIENLGLTEIKSLFSGEDLRLVLQGFSESLSQTFYLAVGLAGFSIVGSLMTDWKSVKEKRS